MEDKYFEMLYQNDLFSELSREEFEKVYQFSRKVEFQKGDFIFQEGEEASEFFVILEGQVEVLKSGSQGKSLVPITTLSAGDLVGEMTLLDSGQRSAFAKALTSVTAFSISFADLKAIAEQDLNFNKLLVKISKKLSLRLRRSNETTIRMLEQQLEEQKVRVALGIFMVNVIVALCVFTFALTWLNSLNQGVSGNGMINPGNIVASFAFLVFVLIVMKLSRLPMSAFGLTFLGWRRALWEGFFYTALLCGFIAFLKWIFVLVIPAYANSPVLSLYHHVRGTYNLHTSKETIWLASMLIYCLIVAPLQELLTRGGLQGPLEIFFTGRARKLKAILISNIIFSTAHLFISMQFAIIVFFAGVYFGWLYSRHHNLLGVTVAHALLGGWAFWVVGIYP